MPKPIRKREDSIPTALNNALAAGTTDCPGCGRDAELVSNYLRDLRVYNRSKIATIGSLSSGFGTVQTGTLIRTPPGMREPKPGFLSRNFSIVVTLMGGLFLTVIIFIGLVVVMPALSHTEYGFVLSLVGGFMAFTAIKRRLPSFSAYSMDDLQARWRRSKYCLRCNAVFIPGETIYTAPEFLNRLLAYAPRNKIPPAANVR